MSHFSTKPRFPAPRREDLTTGQAPDLTGISVLIADHDVPFAQSLRLSLEKFGARVFVAPDHNGAAAILSSGVIDVIAASLLMADERLIGMVRDYKTAHPAALFYLLTEEEYDLVESSEESVRFVVDDYIQKPVDVTRFGGMIGTDLGRPRTVSTSLAVIEPIVTQVKPYFIFRSPAMRRALANIAEIAASNHTVLISGETGTGKELLARAVHVLSPRSQGPFVPINCGAIPESLIEGELFGHEKGAFTGAYATRKGKFETAHQGTLFLDEIGDMPLGLQVRLLRVIEEKKVYRIGSERPIPVDVRVIAATAVELEKAVRDRLFREDLYYRLNVLRLSLPPLRERVEDIPLLALHFLERALAEMGRKRPFPGLSPETIHLLQTFPWRGNVRELRNIMTRIATLLPPDSRKIFPFHVLPHLEDTGELFRPASRTGSDSRITVPLGTSLDKVEELVIRETLKKTNGNKTTAAGILGISVRTLRRKLNRISG
jgi:two-component system response regulator HydG